MPQKLTLRRPAWKKLSAGAGWEWFSAGYALCTIMEMTREENGFEALLQALSRAIQKRREVLGLSQEELASRSVLNRSYLSDLER